MLGFRGQGVLQLFIQSVQGFGVSFVLMKFVTLRLHIFYRLLDGLLYHNTVCLGGLFRVLVGRVGWRGICPAWHLGVYGVGLPSPITYFPGDWKL